MESKLFDVQKVLEGAVVRCREPHFTPTIEKAASQQSPYALVGSVSCATGSMSLCWMSDGRAALRPSGLFGDHPDSDFDLVMAT
jgi:hypothetical protein